MKILAAIAALALAIVSGPAGAVPIEGRFTSVDGSAIGQFSFEYAGAIVDDPGRLTSGFIEFGSYRFDEAQLRFQYYQIQDSLSVRIFADESTGLETGDFVSLQFGNPDGPALELPTQGRLGYALDGERGGFGGTVAAVPEPLSAGLFAGGVLALAARRRRRRAARAS